MLRFAAGLGDNYFWGGTMTGDLHLLLNSISEAILIHRGKDEVLFINERFANLLGAASVDEALEALGAENDFLSIVHEDDRGIIAYYTESRINGIEDVPSRYEFRMIPIDGKVRRFDCTVKIIEWQGAPAAFVTLTDITRQHETESKAQLIQALLEETLDAVPIPVTLTNLEDGRVVYRNKQVTELFGYAKSEMSKTTVEFGTWGDLRDREYVVSEIAEGRAVHHYNCNLRTKSGKTIPVSFNARAIKSQPTPLMVSSPCDRTKEIALNQALEQSYSEVTKAEEEARKAATFLSAVLDNIGQGVVVFDAGLNIVAWNNTYIEMFAYPENFIRKGIHLREIYLHNANQGAYGPGDVQAQADDRVQNILAIIDSGGGSSDIERPNGTIIEMALAEMEEHILVSTLTDVTEVRQKHKKVRDQAYRDGLTGLANRRSFDARIKSTLKEAGEHGTGTILAILDLDNFKAVNDLHGHAIGDATLKEVAMIIRRHIRTSDFAFRLGGDEFAIIFRNSQKVSPAKMRLEKIVADITAIEEISGVDIDIGSSVGLHFAFEENSCEATLFEKADSALYAAKKAGKGRVHTSI